MHRLEARTIVWIFTLLALMSAPALAQEQEAAPDTGDTPTMEAGEDSGGFATGESADEAPADDAVDSNGDSANEGETGEESQEDPQNQPPPDLFGGPFIWIMLGGFVLLWLWMGRSRKKQESKRREMLASLKKGDKVVSIGGIIGTIIETRDDEIVVKVDDNTRMKFLRSAIRNAGEGVQEEKTTEESQ